MKIRIPIREQLGAIVLLAALVGLAVISIATWVTNHNFVLSIRASRLSLTASLKAAQLNSNLNLMQTLIRSATSRLLIQSALQRYNNGNNTDANWVRTRDDLGVILSGSGSDSLLLQAQIYAKNDTGLSGTNTTLVQVTGQGVERRIPLGGSYEDGSPINFGDRTPQGYPQSLYPNFTYPAARSDNPQDYAVEYNGRRYHSESNILLGPWQVNSTFSILSLTVPVINNTSSFDVLGWLTIVADARLIQDVVSAEEGLDDTGITLLVGPSDLSNKFADGVLPGTYEGEPPADVSVGFVLPPLTNTESGHRHENSSFGNLRRTFDYNEIPAVHRGFTRTTNAVNNAGSMISTTNEEGHDVSIGFARPANNVVDWLVIVEQAHGEVWRPINRLRNILLACIFGTLGVMIILAFPAAHFFSRPIRRLRDATRRSVSPYSYGPGTDSSGSGTPPATGDGPSDDEEAVIARKEGFLGTIKRLTHRLTPSEYARKHERRTFRIPGKVKDRKHLIHDELTDLTATFNEMSDELMMQYEKLEERVAQRTAELELSKKAAEAANETKTLFIANISHELKTPLNGILGMAAVCMSQQDPVRLKHDLGVIYKSGDLLLNLLNDLLTFSKNQVGQNLTLEEKEFRLRDISSQVLAIFDKQAKENGVTLSVKFEGPVEANMDETTGQPRESLAYAPFGLGKVKDMVLWGDQHRILQVMINLVSNSLKFTPRGGSVTATIRCNGAGEAVISRKTSTHSHQTSGHNSRTGSRLQRGSDASVATPRMMDTATHINGMDKPSVFSQVMAMDRPASPPPGRILEFEFEVVDTGPGIPENQQQRIFEPFVQGDLGLNKKHGGTGLGLSICSQLATLLKGNISLKSEVGVGSTFLMQIPLKHLHNRTGSTASSSIGGSIASRRNSAEISRPDSASTTEIAASRNLPPSPRTGPVKAIQNDSQPRLVGLTDPFFASDVGMTDAGGGKIRVLVAEDNKTNQMVVLQMLKLEDVYDVTVAQDGQEAFDLVKDSISNNRPFDLIFMDVQMPNLDGLQSTRLIRQAGYSAPIVALTAYAEESNVKECMDSGMDYFLSKPIRRPQLKHVLKTYCPPILEEDEPSPGTTQNGVRERKKSASAA